MKSYLPQWAKPGCKIIKEWEEEFETAGYCGIKYMITYENHKNQTITCLKWVKWKD